MGGFRRPTSSSFYQVKKGGIYKPTGFKKVNADIQTTEKAVVKDPSAQNLSQPILKKGNSG